MTGDFFEGWGSRGWGRFGVLAWPEERSPLQGRGSAHPGPSLAAVGYLREAEQVQSRPRHRVGPRGDVSIPRPQRDGGPEPLGQRHLLRPTPQVGPLRDARLKIPIPGRCAVPGLSGGSGWPGTPSRRPRPAGARAAEPRRSGCSSNGFIPAEAGSKAGSDLDGFLLNNGEGARSLLLLARETRVFQSIRFWE